MIPVVVSVLVFFAYAPFAQAALPNAADPTGSTGPCIKVSFRGDASTYNPNYPGWRTGGQGVATGGGYNSNEYEAALQTDIAKYYRCGYGTGATCHAVVLAGNGKGAVVRINDNGPLVAGRIIDLNEKSMQYLSGGSMGQNSGVLRDVTVTLLCGIEGMALGPLDPAERQTWANRTFDAKTVQTSLYNTAAPVGVSTQGLAQQLGQGQCIVSIQPLIVVSCSAIANQGMQPLTTPAGLSGQTVGSSPVTSPVSLSNTVPPSTLSSVPEEVPKRSIGDLLLPFMFSAQSSTGTLPLVLTKQIGRDTTNLKPTDISAIASGTVQLSANTSQGMDTFGGGYRSADLQSSPAQPTPFFRPFLLQVESILRSIIDLIKKL